MQSSFPFSLFFSVFLFFTAFIVLAAILGGICAAHANRIAYDTFFRSEAPYSASCVLCILFPISCVPSPPLRLPSPLHFRLKVQFGYATALILHMEFVLAPWNVLRHAATRDVPHSLWVYVCVSFQLAEILANCFQLWRIL